MIIIGFKSLREGYRPARFYLASWVFLLVGIFIKSVSAFGVIPSSFCIEYGMQIGSAIEVTLLSFALADRINVIKKEREQALKAQVTESQKNLALQNIFQKFVPKQFLYRIADQGIENIELGKAQSDTITILFSDIRSFTNLSETMSPQDLMNLLNAYFKRMNKPIHENQGFIDKFIGDAIMALFDMPEEKDKEEATCAVRAAIGMQESLREYNQHRTNSGYIPIEAGIGINSGQVIIGTVGSQDRMDSTVLGDVVNLASRLEGLNKQYHSQIIISSNTWRLVKENDFILGRELDFVIVKGRDKPESIFEIFNANESEIRDKKHQILKPYHEGLMNYFSQNWDDAIKLFEYCLKIYPQDVVSQRYLGRCMKFKSGPPEKDWNGALILDFK